MEKRNEIIGFKEQEKILKLKQKNHLEKHQMKMKELVFQRESEQIKHDLELERGRIKSAEIRKMQQRKEEAWQSRKY